MLDILSKRPTQNATEPHLALYTTAFEALQRRMVGATGRAPEACGNQSKTRGWQAKKLGNRYNSFQHLRLVVHSTNWFAALCTMCNKLGTASGWSKSHQVRRSFILHVVQECVSRPLHLVDWEVAALPNKTPP